MMHAHPTHTPGAAQWQRAGGTAPGQGAEGEGELTTSSSSSLYGTTSTLNTGDSYVDLGA